MTQPDPSWCARLHAHRVPARLSQEPVPPPPPDSAPVRREIPSVHHCDLCGAAMYDHNCKIVCPNCGYKRDCSDP